MDKYLLEVNNLTLEFHDHQLPETVVKDLSFQVKCGEIVGIVGESGSGKSMTAMAIAGLLNRKDLSREGEIIFANKELLHLERKELRKLQGDRISVIFQEPMTSLNPLKKVGWQIEESLRIHQKLSKEEYRKQAEKWMQNMGLSTDTYHKYPHELSGGMRQRVMIAAAMISNPDLLIADEPTTALDVTIQAQILKLLKQINEEEHTAILFISHDLSLVRQLCDHVIVMYQGELIEEGPCERIFTNPESDYTKKLIQSIPKVCL